MANLYGVPKKRVDEVLEMLRLTFLIISFVGSRIVGAITLGLGNNREGLDMFINNIKVYGSIILPLLSFSTVMSFIAVLINNSGAMIGFGIGIDVIMMIIDSQFKNIIRGTFVIGVPSFLSSPKNNTVIKLVKIS